VAAVFAVGAVAVTAAMQLPNFERAQLSPASSAPPSPTELFPTPQQITSDLESLTGFPLDREKTETDGPDDHGVNVWTVIAGDAVHTLSVGMAYVPEEKLWSGLPELCEPGETEQDDHYQEHSRCRRLPDGSALRTLIGKPPTKEKWESLRPLEGNTGPLPTAVRRYAQVTHVNSWRTWVEESAPPGTDRLSGIQMEDLLLALDAKYFRADAPSRPIDPDLVHLLPRPSAS
jgi:hypothetical protein